MTRPDAVRTTDVSLKGLSDSTVRIRSEESCETCAREGPAGVCGEPTLMPTEQVVAAVTTPSVGLNAEMSASRNADIGIAATSGDSQQGLVYGIVFLMW